MVKLPPPKHESTNAIRAWLDYRNMPEPRSLKRLCDEYRSRDPDDPGYVRPPTRNIAALHNWSAHFGWQLRLQHEANEAMALARQNAIKKMARVRIDFQDTMVDAAQRLVKRAQEMESYPLHEETVTEYDGEGNAITTIVHPIRWAASDIARNYEAAAKLMAAVLQVGPQERDPADVDQVIRDMLDREGVVDPALREQIAADVRAQVEKL